MRQIWPLVCRGGWSVLRRLGATLGILLWWLDGTLLCRMHRYCPVLFLWFVSFPGLSRVLLLLGMLFPHGTFWFFFVRLQIPPMRNNTILCRVFFIRFFCFFSDGCEYFLECCTTNTPLDNHDNWDCLRFFEVSFEPQPPRIGYADKYWLHGWVIQLVDLGSIFRVWYMCWSSQLNQVSSWRAAYHQWLGR